MVILLMCVSRDTRRRDFPQVDGWSTDTPGMGHHTIEWNIDLDIIEMSNCTKYPRNILSLSVP